MKQSKFQRVFCTLALVLVLCAGAALPAFAIGSPIYGTEEEPAQAAVTKMLVMPEGTITPAASFTFAFAKKSLNESSEASDLAAMPAISDKTVTFTAADEGTTAGGIKSIPRETADVLAGITWPHAGVYVYTVTETPDTYEITDNFAEQMTYSSASYDLAVYVENGEDGPFVAAIASIIKVKDTPDQGDVDDKVDPTPGGDPEIPGDYSKMIFTNTYLKNNGGTDPTDTVLSISKTVDGAMGDLTKYFPFTVTLTKPATITGSVTYKAYVLDASDDVVTSTDNADAASIKTDASNKQYIEITAGTPITINLKHGQRLSFVDMPVGSSYIAVESAVAGYTPGAAVTVNGEVPPIELPGTVNTPLSTGDRLIGENANAADFTNTYETVTPMGIIIDNLPYIALIVIAIGAFVAFVVIKSRRKSRYASK